MLPKVPNNNDWPLVLSFTLIVILCARDYKLIAVLPMLAWLWKNKKT